MSQEFESGLAGLFWLGGLSRGCRQDVGQSDSYLRVRLGLENPLWRWLIHLCAELVVVVDRKPLFLRIFMTWCLASSWKWFKTSKQHCVKWLSLRVTHSNFHHILLVPENSSDVRQKGPRRSGTTRRQGSWAIWKTGSHGDRFVLELNE